MTDRAARWVKGGLLRAVPNRWKRAAGFAERVKRCGEPFCSMETEALKNEADDLRMQFTRQGLKEPLLARAFALVREAAFREIAMRHFDCQIMGGRILLDGMVAEMETGEGKTLTATLAAAAAALSGVPVHVVTVNDYLTERDAEWMGPVYQALGIRVGHIVHGMSPAERRRAYDCEVTYCTNKEITFDYLRDWITLEGRASPRRLQAEYLFGRGSRTDRLLLRGLHFAIVDEADSVLIDEARTPLIISRETEIGGEKAFMEQAMDLAGRLRKGADYRVDTMERRVDLTESGKSRIREYAKQTGPLWKGTVRREDIVRLALTAHNLFRRDEQYVVINGKIQIVDEFTGRVMPDRSYEKGLHQLIEIKEGCDISRRSETQARISYQRFFRRYLHLAGMTGTAREVSGELWSVYGLQVVRIPTHRKMQRKKLPDTIFRASEEKWAEITERVRRENEKGRPVLIGTRSVAASEKASRLLSRIGLDHQTLNAKQDSEEAGIIAKAGEAGCITIATNMAGRGTDIKLGRGVKEKMGLHVILTERHEARRIDRQLAGRCARQGDPGSHEAILSMEDPIVGGGRGGIAAWVMSRLLRERSPAWNRMAGWIMVGAQKRTERLHAGIRSALLKDDERRGDILSFSGRDE